MVSLDECLICLICSTGNFKGISTRCTMLGYNGIFNGIRSFIKASTSNFKHFKGILTGSLTRI